MQLGSQNLKKILFVLTKKQRKNIYALLALAVIAVGFEVLGISLFIPIISILIDSNNQSNFPLIKNLINEFGGNSEINILFYFIAILTLIYFIKCIFLIYFNWYQNKIVNNIMHIQSKKLFEMYLNKDYLFHLTKNSAELLRNIEHTVNSFQTVILWTTTLVVETFIMISLLSFLVFYEPIVSSIGLIISLAIIFTIYYASKSKIYMWGQKNLKKSEVYRKHLLQGFNGIKEIKFLKKENIFASYYDKTIKEYTDINTLTQTTLNAPKLIIEFIVILLFSGLIFLIIQLGYDNTKIITILGIFGVVTIRVLPSINRVLFSLQTIKHYTSSIDVLYQEFKMVKLFEKKIKNNNNNLFFKFDKKILFNNVEFIYPNSKITTIKNISFEIKKGEMISISGKTGSGKSTIINNFLGLLEPNLGSIQVDGANIFENIDAWQNKIGYVPQSIFLLDDSIKNNIAFGIKKEEIKEDRISDVIKKAQLEGFINQQRDGLDTFVGERGARISGGQLQRIAIARALYNDPEIIVFDEATNALDEDTEKEVMKILFELKGKKTILLISHSYQNLINCDKNFELVNGTLKQRN